MGEEWGSSSPFQFFSSHPEPELARATAEGRKARVRRARLGCRRNPRPAGSRDVPAVEAELGRDRRRRPRPAASRLPRTDRAAAHRTRHGRPVAGPHGGRLRRGRSAGSCMHRGALAIACNLSADEVTVPVTGEVRAGLGRAECRRRIHPAGWAFVRGAADGAVRAGSGTPASRAPTSRHECRTPSSARAGPRGRRPSRVRRRPAPRPSPGCCA